MIPWSLYNLTPRDQAQPTLRPYTVNQTIVGVGVTGNTATWDVPSDSAWLITAMCTQMVTTTTPFQISHRVFDGTLTNRKFDATKFRDNVAQLNQMAENIFGQPLLLAMGGDQVQSIVSCLVAGNITSIHTVSGILIPRGTIQLN